MTAGLPAADLGRIGLAVAPSDPDIVYAVVEAAEQGRRHLTAAPTSATTWRSGTRSTSQAQYYAHLVVDPVNKHDRVYVMNVCIQVRTTTAARTLAPCSASGTSTSTTTPSGIDPEEPELLPGRLRRRACTRASTGGHFWHFQANLSRDAVLRHGPSIRTRRPAPFYHVYGGTQDNFTLGGPARTRSAATASRTCDWFVVPGRGRVPLRGRPGRPGHRVRRVPVRRVLPVRPARPAPGSTSKPLAGPRRAAAAVELGLAARRQSPHAAKRLYYAANRLYKSRPTGATRGTPVSPDLTREARPRPAAGDGQTVGPDAVFKHGSTSFYGNIVALAESPKAEGDAVRAGTDDGLIQSTDRRRGKTWRKVEDLPRRAGPDLRERSWSPRRHDAGDRVRRLRQPQERRLQAVPC